MKSVYSTRIAIVTLLLGLALLIVACSTQNEAVDNSPNAKLSNEELLTAALANMTHLNSYHLEFAGGLPSTYIKMSPTLVITADIQPQAKGTRITMRDAGGGAVGSPSLILDAGNGIDVLITQDGWYERYVGEPQWEKPQVDTPAGWLMGMFGWMWPLSNDSAGTDPSPGQAETLLKALAFRDGTPRTEQLEGGTTRHLVADFNNANMRPDPMAFGGLEGAKTAGVWLSTEMTPTVRQLQITGSNVVLTNEMGPANGVAFSPDSKTLAVAHGHAEDWNIRLWDLSRPGTTPQKLKGTGGLFKSVAFSPDGTKLAAGVYTGGGPGNLHLWDVAHLDRPPALLPVLGSIGLVAFRPDGQMMAAAVSNGVYLWSPPYVGTAPTVLSPSNDDVVYAVAFSPNNYTLAAGGLKSGVRLYDVRQPQTAPTVLSHEQVKSVAFSPDGRWLAATGVKLWALGSASPSPIALADGEAGDEAVAFSPDGRFLAASGQGGKLQVWDLVAQSSAGALKPATTIDSLGLVYSVAFSPDGTSLAAATEKGTVYLWNMAALLSTTKPGEPGAHPTATIIQEDEQSTDTPYTLTWKWSRFNEDLGAVQAPPPEDIKTP